MKFDISKVAVITLWMRVFHCIGQSNRPAILENSQSLIFALPDAMGDEDGANYMCSLFSSNYCLIGYVISRTQSARFPHEEDFYDFWEMILPMYRDLNWFSVSRTFNFELGHCCNYQSTVYRMFGQDRGVSPAFFLEKVTNFTSHGKRLNSIKADFRRDLCVNIIQTVGFGTGSLKRRGGMQGVVYIFPPDGDERVHLFSYNNIQRELQFDWFKENIICEDQPWICEKFPPITDYHDFQHRRRLLSYNLISTYNDSDV
ncbi:uncharacterized protein LOC142348746 [Convolutriloba macropyga]|uniref:uncharacterized protein LOC142348746 n=1 Tax=Convolutriloba macropyga TaxID=536237 RepID=UPI003F51D184